MTMQSYIVETEQDITRQEGDTGSIQFTIPVVLNPASYTILFKVFTRNGTVVFTKADAAWTRATQTITAYLAAVDTKGYEGNHRWELQFSSATEVITVGKGCFKILKEEIV